MNLLGSVFRELIGLFVDDGSLALEIVAVVALAAIAVSARVCASGHSAPPPLGHWCRR